MRSLILATMIFMLAACGGQGECLRGECKIKKVVETIVIHDGNATVITPVEPAVALVGNLELTVVCPNVQQVLIVKTENGATYGSFMNDDVAKGKKIVLDGVPVGFYDIYFKRDNGSEDEQHLLVSEGITTTTCERN